MKKSDAWVRFIFKSVRDMAPVLIPPTCIPDEMADSGRQSPSWVLNIDAIKISI